MHSYSISVHSMKYKFMIANYCRKNMMKVINFIVASDYKNCIYPLKILRGCTADLC